MKNPSTRSHPSTIVNRTVTPRRPRNADLREREYLTPKEVERLQDAARKHSRYGHRDATAILIAYRHGLRASELCELTWNMIELDSGRIHVRRAKNGVDSTPARKSGPCASCDGRTCTAASSSTPNAAAQ
jgi:integrase